MNTQERAKALVDHNRTSTQIFFGAQSALLEVSPPEDSEVLAQSLAIRYRHGHYAPPHTAAISKRPRPRQPRVSHPPARSAPSDLIAKQHAEPEKTEIRHSEASVAHGALEASVQRAIDAVDTHAVRSTQKTAHVGRETLAIVKSTKESTKNALTLAKDAPEWHAPWVPFRQISGHLGWVRSVAVDPSNHWFATGSSDRTVKIWDLASGRLKLTLTGHISAVRGLVISERHPYMFSVGEDKTVKCWDLEQNKVIRNYHGHLSGVYCASLHPTLDVLVTGGRDSTVRVWDIRTRAAVFVLPGHRDTVNALLTDVVDPQIVSASVDSTIRMWDLAAGRCSGTLTNHKKGVRALVRHPRLFSFASASADAIKTWGLPQGTFMRNLTQHNGLVNALAVNEDGVMASGGDNGTLCMWDYAAAHCFQTEKTRVQPGSLDCEAGIFAMAFDRSGSRLITCEADKTIKMWKEDEEATKETHPLNWKPNLDEKRY